MPPKGAAKAAKGQDKAKQAAKQKVSGMPALSRSAHPPISRAEPMLCQQQKLYRPLMEMHFRRGCSAASLIDL